MLQIPEETVRTYENGFLDGLLQEIKFDPVLSHFYTRLICECDNITKVIKVAREIDILDLEEIVENLTNAKNVIELSKYDSEFHKRLFTITGDLEFFKWWRLQSLSLNKFLNSFWDEIGFGTPHYFELITLHNRIYQAVKEKKPGVAVATMQKHFSILLFQLLSMKY